MMVAVVGHALWLAHAELRLRRQPLPGALRSRDDSPELLEFSRLPPESLAPAPIPLPPEEASPPPPLPERGSATSNATAKFEEKAAAQPAPPSSRPRGVSPGGASPGGAGRVTKPVAIKPPVDKAPAKKSTASKPSASKPSASKPSASKPPASHSAGGTAAATKSAGGRPAFAQQTATSSQPRQREEPSLTPLRRLEDARRSGLARLQGGMLQSWRSLWQEAETEAQAGASPPSALAERREEIELRRIPLARARADGLEPSHGEVLRLDDHLLLAWIDGSQLWLLRAPA